MGALIYKIKSRPIGRYAGQPAYPADFAYKPYRPWWGTDSCDTKMAFQTGVTSCVHAWSKKPDDARKNVLVAVGDKQHGYNLYRIDSCEGYVLDDEAFDQPRVTENWFPGGTR